MKLFSTHCLTKYFLNEGVMLMPYLDRDITYCSNLKCRYKDCFRHLNRVVQYMQAVGDVGENNYISMADFTGECLECLVYAEGSFDNV